MVTPEDILRKALSRYGAFLANDSNLSPVSFFPLIIPCDKKLNYPDSKALDIGMTHLFSSSTAGRRLSYSIDTETKMTKLFGEQTVPKTVYFKDERNFLHFIGKEAETEIFRRLFRQTVDRFPELREKIVKLHTEVVNHESEWEDILRVCSYFKKNPQPHQFVRELNIGVHTKFVEEHQKILRPLLDTIVGKDRIDEHAATFYGRFNLKEGDPRVTFRILDREISKKYFSGLSYISAYVYEINRLHLPLQKVFIVENENNLEFFRDTPSTIVIWGEGFKVAVLRDVEWLKNVDIYYWGDIDLHGYEILSTARRCFPHIKSIMMDRAAMNVHPTRTAGKTSKTEKELLLDNDEREMYQFVKSANLRYEQELLPKDYIRSILDNLN